MPNESYYESLGLSEFGFTDKTTADEAKAEHQEKISSILEQEKTSSEIPQPPVEVLERPETLVSDNIDQWEINAEEAENLVAAYDFATNCTARWQEQFWTMVKKDRDERGAPSDAVIELVKKRDWDKPNFTFMAGEHAAAFLRGKNLGEKIYDDSILMVVDLPKPIDQFHTKGDLNFEEKLELGIYTNKPSEQTDVGGMVIEWGKYYIACHNQVWDSIKDVGSDRGVYFDRNNAPGQHTPGEYYYVFEVVNQNTKYGEEETKLINADAIATTLLEWGDEKEKELAEQLRNALDDMNFGDMKRINTELADYQKTLYGAEHAEWATRQDMMDTLFNDGSGKYRLLETPENKPIKMELEDAALVEFINTHNPRLLEFYDPEKKEVFQVVSLEIDTTALPKLPKGYGYSGGAVRSALLRAMGDNKEPAPRDLDLIAIDEFNPDISLERALSLKYMPIDVQNGYGVSGIKDEDGSLIAGESMGLYFKTRDFTLNQGLIHGNRAYATVDALRDLKDKVIRPTEFEQQAWYNNGHKGYGVKSKLVMKSLRMQVNFEETYGYGKTENIAAWQWEVKNIPPFHIALELEKATQQGDNVAKGYFLKLKEKGMVVSSNQEKTDQALVANTMEGLGLTLRSKMIEEGRMPFEFTDPSLNSGMGEVELYEKYADLAEQHYGRQRN